jgi:hypothetical protein
LMSAVSLHCKEVVRRTENGSVLDLTLHMEISQIASTAKDDLMILAATSGTGEKIGLLIDIPKGKFQKGEKTRDGVVTYRFPIYFRPPEAGAEALDRLVSSYFGKGKQITLFKQRGYTGAALLKPNKLGQKGGTIFVSDAALEGAFFWSITLNLDVKNRALTMVIGELRYN